MKQISVYCVTVEKDMMADVLSESDKRIVCVLEDTDLKLTLHTEDHKIGMKGSTLYFGHIGKYEFESFGIVDEDLDLVSFNDL